MSIRIGRIVFENIVIGESNPDNYIFDCCNCPVSTPNECCGDKTPCGPSGPSQTTVGPVPEVVSYSNYPQTITDFKKSFQPEVLLKNSVDILQKVTSSTGGVSDEFVNLVRQFIYPSLPNDWCESINKINSTGRYVPTGSDGHKSSDKFIDSLSNLATSVLRSLSINDSEKKQKEIAAKWEAILNSDGPRPATNPEAPIEKNTTVDHNVD
jgi:hypothetical protein